MDQGPARVRIQEHYHRHGSTMGPPYWGPPPTDDDWGADMEEQTCGRGLAENSVLPAQLAEVTEAMADNLQAHLQALELDDEAARQEHAVYLRLAEEQRQAAGRLRAVAGEMAAARDLPMGRHDAQTMTSPEVADAFQHFIKAKRELLALLQRMTDQDERLLAAMGGAGGGEAAAQGA
jgi:hypothetical protein